MTRRYHPIETEAIMHMASEHTPWKEIARKIGRDVDPSSIRQHVRRVIHKKRTYPSYPQGEAADGGTSVVYMEGRQLGTGT